MQKYNFIGKTLDEALDNAGKELMCNRNEFYYKELETKNGLFRSKKVEIEVFKKTDIISDIKSFLRNIISQIGLDANFEVKTREDTTMITVFCENNNILIGKQGRTINALSIILKQYLTNELGFNYKVILDVSDYKAKNQKRLERLAKNVAREVSKTKVDAKLDPMNSYERRIIHTILGDYKNITTESTGEEPKRCVVIKYTENKQTNIK